MNSLFTPEELAELAAADAEIEATFSLTNEDIGRSRETDKAAMLGRLPPAKKKKAAYWRAYYEANREEISAKRRAYYEKNREKKLAYQRAYDAAHREEKAIKNRAYREAKRDGGKRRGTHTESQLRKGQPCLPGSHRAAGVAAGQDRPCGGMGDR